MKIQDTTLETSNKKKRSDFIHPEQGGDFKKTLVLIGRIMPIGTGGFFADRGTLTT